MNCYNLINDVPLVNKNLTHKMYLYDNFYKDNIEIVKLFENDSNICKNPIINDFKTLFEYILDAKIKTLSSNIIKLTNDYSIQEPYYEWYAVIFLNPNIPLDNGLAFMQESFNSNNKVDTDISYSKPLIIEDFFHANPNRVILFNSIYYHKIIVKLPMLVEIVYIKLQPM